MEVIVWKNYSHGRAINQHILNFNGSSCFDGVLYKEYFIDWILKIILFTQILEDFKLQLVSRKLK